MAQQIEGFEKIASVEHYRKTKEGVEISPRLCEFAGLAIPVFMTKKLFYRHLPDDLTWKRQLASKEGNILNTLVALRWVSTGWTGLLERMESTIPAGEKSMDLDILALLVPADEPFIILNDAEELEDLFEMGGIEQDG